MSPELEQQERAARSSRAYLAFLRCKCGRCDPKNIHECEICARFQPECLTRTAHDHEGGEWRACLDGCKGVGE